MLFYKEVPFKNFFLFYAEHFQHVRKAGRESEREREKKKEQRVLRDAPRNRKPLLFKKQDNLFLTDHTY